MLLLCAQIVKNAPFATDPSYYPTVRRADSKRPPVQKRNQNMEFEKEMEEVRYIFFILFKQYSKFNFFFSTGSNAFLIYWFVAFFQKRC